MRILYVVPTARFFVSHRLPLAIAARDAGHEVHVATADGDEVPQIRAEGLQWHRARFGPMRRKPWSDLQSLYDVIRLYRRFSPDLVHHVTFKAVLYGTIAARLWRVPAVVNAMTGLGDVFDVLTLTDRFWMRLIVTLFRTFVRYPNMRVIFQNPDDMRLLIDEHAVRADQVTLIRGSGVDPAWYVPAARTNRVPVVMFVARLVWTKGLGEFVAAVRRLRSEKLEAQFVIAGELDRDSGRSVGEAQIEEWKRDAGIEYAGFVEDARQLYAAADIICLPSYRVEGLPKALLEAASSGLPIVATDVPGNREIVRHGENGLLVPVRSVDELAGAIRLLLLDRDLRERMGGRGREIVIREFSLATVIRQTLAVYEQLNPLQSR